MSIDFKVDEAGIALITINRPEKLNALDAEHYKQLSEAWERVRDDSTVRVAIITGAGNKSFCAGADIKAWIGRETELSELWLTQKGQLLNRGLEVWKPVIAAINGLAIGGGTTLMLATDIRVAVADATFGVAEVRRGIIAGNGGTQRIAKQLPHCIAMEMLLVGNTITAAIAERWGLINRVVARENLIDVAYEYARQIASNAPLAVQASKELAIRSRDLDLAQGLRLEQITNHILQRTEDVKEGRAAFSEKRAPKFLGR